MWKLHSYTIAQPFWTLVNHTISFLSFFFSSCLNIRMLNCCSVTHYEISPQFFIRLLMNHLYIMNFLTLNGQYLTLRGSFICSCTVHSWSYDTCSMKHTKDSIVIFSCSLGCCNVQLSIYRFDLQHVEKHTFFPSGFCFNIDLVNSCEGYHCLLFLIRLRNSIFHLH